LDPGPGRSLRAHRPRHLAVGERAGDRHGSTERPAEQRPARLTGAEAHAEAGLGQPDAGRPGHLVLRPPLADTPRRHRPRSTARRWGALPAGSDLALPPGTPVLAVGAGTVEAAGWLYAGYGISVVINHGNGYLTHYAHLSKATVSPGQRVSAGQQIGAEGSTGDSTGPHLHFEVHRGMWNQIEPA